MDKKTTKKYATEKPVTYFDFFIKNIIIIHTVKNNIKTKYFKNN